MEPIQIGRYVAVQLLGRGGMGAVYLATDPALDRQIVVKLLSYAHDDEHFRERFAREARSAARIRHRNIVTIYDIGTDAEDRPYIAMEYVDGETLAAIIRRRAPLTLGRKLDYLKQVCSARRRPTTDATVSRQSCPGSLAARSAPIHGAATETWRNSSPRSYRCSARESGRRRAMTSS